MPIRINDLSVVSQENQVVPRAAQFAEFYLKTLAGLIVEIEPPVTMDLDVVQAARGLGGGKHTCLVVTPTKQRLRRYCTAHFATPVGAGLNIGYWLLGGEYANGRSIGVMNIGAATDVDVSEVLSIVEMVRDYAVLPALDEVVQAATPGAQPGGRGFLGA